MSVVDDRLAPLRAAWAARDARERRLLLLALLVVAVYLLWAVGLQPALRTLRDAPPRLDTLDAQLQQMQAQAADAAGWRAQPPVPRAQASAALQAATGRLGDKGRLVQQGERSVLMLQGASGEQLRAWLNEARTSARARAVEMQLVRSERGLTGTVVVALPGG